MTVIIMKEPVIIKRTDGGNPDFQQLVHQLDNELRNELKEDQATYDQYNKVPDIKTVTVLYANGRAVACGCFKKYDENTIEIKRMFVEKEARGNGFSKLILDELERWAIESGFHYAILETSMHFVAAQNLYKKNGYDIIKNYDQYIGLSESVCMKKKFI